MSFAILIMLPNQFLIINTIFIPDHVQYVQITTLIFKPIARNKSQPSILNLFFCFNRIIIYLKSKMILNVWAATDNPTEKKKF